MSVFLLRIGVAIGVGVITIVGGILLGALKERQQLRRDASRQNNFVASNVTNCCICLQDLTPRHLIFTLPCKHRFHIDCIYTVFKEQARYHRSCPICRGIVEPTVFSELKKLNDAYYGENEHLEM